MNRTLNVSTRPYFVTAAASRPSGLAAGVALSLLLHGMLLFAWRYSPQPAPQAPKADAPLTVWLRPAPQRLPAPPPELVPPEPERPPAPQPTPRKPLKTEQAREQGASRGPSKPGHTPATAPITVPAPAAAPTADLRAAETAPKFDIEAARRTARAVATERDPAKEGTAVGQFPEKPLRSETRLAREIGQAKRADCKDGLPGGLLAPVYLMLDKKDHGCKW